MSIKFDIKKSENIDGVKVIVPNISSDRRGTIWTSFMKDELQKLLPKGLEFKHDKFSESRQNVLRGIHGDNKSWKLVTAVYGEIQQVVVDYRSDSQTYKKWESYIINKSNQLLVLIPPGVGNAYYVSSNEAVYHYKLAYEGEYLDADSQFTISWDDPEVDIEWKTKNPILSDRDLRNP
jgi:dTDP-4-dehydrorhamnose 3,5-epimerase